MTIVYIMFVFGSSFGFTQEFDSLNNCMKAKTHLEQTVGKTKNIIVTCEQK